MKDQTTSMTLILEFSIALLYFYLFTYKYKDKIICELNESFIGMNQSRFFSSGNAYTAHDKQDKQNEKKLGYVPVRENNNK